MYQFISFRDPGKNLNLGVCIVKAQTFPEAVRAAWDKKINPGGEALGFPLTQKGFEGEGLELNRLYGRAELVELEYEFL